MFAPWDFAPAVGYAPPAQQQAAAPFGAFVVPETLDGEALGVMLESLVQLNAAFLRRHPETPWLYQSGVRYGEEMPGQEHWLTIPWVLRQGWADCEDLCAWRCAELRVRGGLLDLGARCVWDFHHMPGKLLAHVRVRRGFGRYEDPSARLGMGTVGGGARWALLPYRS